MSPGKQRVIHEFTPSIIVIERVPTRAKLTAMQFACCVLAGLNRTYQEMADELLIASSTARYHIEEAARKIPGDLPALAKCGIWARGATREVLEGTALKVEVVSRATNGTRRERNRRSPQSADGAQAPTL